MCSEGLALSCSSHKDVPIHSVKESSCKANVISQLQVSQSQPPGKTHEVMQEGKKSVKPVEMQVKAGKATTQKGNYF